MAILALNPPKMAKITGWGKTFEGEKVPPGAPSGTQTPLPRASASPNPRRNDTENRLKHPPNPARTGNQNAKTGRKQTKQNQKCEKMANRTPESCQKSKNIVKDDSKTTKKKSDLTINALNQDRTYNTTIVMTAYVVIQVSSFDTSFVDAICHRNEANSMNVLAVRFSSHPVSSVISQSQ
jgi:hypothetical protein